MDDNNSSETRSSGGSSVGGTSNKSLTSSSQVTDYGFIQKVKLTAFESLYDLVDRQFKLEKWIFALLEIVYFIEITASLVGNSFQIGEGKGLFLQIFHIVFIFVDPTKSFSGLIPYIIMFSIASGIVFLVSFGLVYRVYFPNFQFLDIIPYAVRFVRTVMAIPILKILLNPLSCHFFDGSFTWDYIDPTGTIQCLSFPYITFLIVGLIGTFLLLLLCAVDILFFLDRFKHIKYITASSSGRFQFILFLVKIFYITTCQFLETTVAGRTIVDAITFPLFIILLCYNLRVCVYYNILFSVIFTLFLSIWSSLSFSGLIMNITQNDFGYFGLFSMIVITGIGIGVLITKYISVFLYKKSLKKNILYLYNAHDICLSMLNTLKEGEYKKYVSKLLDADSFSKNRSFCFLLGSVLMSSGEFQFAYQLVIHGQNLNDKHLLDISFLSYFYSQKILELQHAGKTKHIKLVKQLKIIRKNESKLNAILKTIYSELLENSNNIKSGLFSALLNQFYDVKSETEKIYTNLIKFIVAKEVYQMYSNFLLRYNNDRTQSDEYVEKAKVLEDLGLTKSARSSNESYDPLQQQQSNKSTSPSLEENIEGYSRDQSIEVNIVSTNTKKNKTKMKKVVSVSSSYNKYINKNEPSIVTSIARRGDERAGPRVKYSHSHSLSRSDYRNVKQRILKSFFTSITFFRFSIMFAFVIGVGVLVGLFVVHTLIQGDIDKSQLLIDEATVLRENAVSIALFARKMQISTLPIEINPHLDERNISDYRHRLDVACDNFFQSAKRLYSSTTYKEVWSFFLPFKNKQMGNYYIENYTLFDGMAVYYSNCQELLKLDDETLKNLTKHHKLVDNGNFYFLMKNEYYITHTLEELVSRLIVSESRIVDVLVWVSFSLPFIVVSLIILFFVSWLCLKRDQRDTLKGFNLIPKKYLVECYQLISGISNNKGNNSGNSNRIQTSQITAFERISFVIVLFLLFITFVCSFFAAYGFILNSAVTQRNVEYDTGNQLSVFVRRIHYRMVDVLYPSYSLFTEDEIISELTYHYIDTKTINNWLKTGNSDLGLSGIDNRAFASDMYYHDSCKYGTNDINKVEDEVFQKISCYSPNRQILLAVNSAENLVSTLTHDNSTSNMKYVIRDMLEAQRKSELYERIVQLDNNKNNIGALNGNYKRFLAVLKTSADTYTSISEILSLLVLILLTPIFVVFWIYIYIKFIPSLYQLLLQVKLIMLLFPSKLLQTTQIYQYLTSQITIKRSLSLKKKEDKNNLFSILDKSSFSILMFNKKFQVFYYNENASMLFNLKTKHNENLSKFLTEESINKIVKWSKNKRMKKSFNSELIAKLGSEQFRVYADITRDISNDTFCALLENIEDSKKKELLKYAEKKTERTEQLLVNILPKSICKGLNIDTLSNGKASFVTIHKACTCIFADICNFTKISATMDEEEVISLLSDVFSGIDNIVTTEKHLKMEKIKTIGDCYFAVSGVPEYSVNHAKNTMEFGIKIINFLNKFNENIKNEEQKIRMRVGLSSGKVVSGIIGKLKWCFDIWGKMVNMAARAEATGLPNKIQICRSTYEYVFDQYEFMERKVNFQGLGLQTVYVYTPAVKKDVTVKKNVVKSDIKVEVVELEEKKVVKEKNVLKPSSIDVVDRIEKQILKGEKGGKRGVKEFNYDGKSVLKYKGEIKNAQTVSKDDITKINEGK